MRDPLRLLLLAGVCAGVSAVSLPAVLGGGIMQAVPLVNWPSVKTPRTIAPSAMPEILAGRGAAHGADRPAGKAPGGQALPLASSTHSTGAVLDELGDAAAPGSEPASTVPAMPPVRQPQSGPLPEQPQARPAAGMTDLGPAPQAQPSAAGSGSPLLPPWAQSQPGRANAGPSMPTALGVTSAGARDQGTSSGLTIPALSGATPPIVGTELQSLQESLRPQTTPRRSPPPIDVPSGNTRPAPRSTGEKPSPANPGTPPSVASSPSDRPSLAALTTAVTGAGGASSTLPPQAVGPTRVIPPSPAEAPGASFPGAALRPPRKPARNTVVAGSAEPTASAVTAAKPASAPSSRNEALATAEGAPTAPRRPAAATSTSPKPRHETFAHSAAPAALPRPGPAQRPTAPGPSYTILFSEGSAAVSRLGIAIVEQAAQAGGTAVLRSSGRPIDRNRLEAVRMEFLMLGVQVVNAEPDPRVASGEVHIEIR